MDDRKNYQLINNAVLNDSRKELLKESDSLTTDDALKKWRMHEASQAHMEALEKRLVKHCQCDRKKTKVQARYIKDCNVCATSHESKLTRAHYGGKDRRHRHIQMSVLLILK